jgi:hypothetical protein
MNSTNKLSLKEFMRMDHITKNDEEKRNTKNINSLP